MTQAELERELVRVNEQCSINSGMGERYEYWHNKQKALLVQLAPHRKLTVFECLCLDFSYDLLVDLIRKQEEPTLEYEGQTIRMVRELERIRSPSLLASGQPGSGRGGNGKSPSRTRLERNRIAKFGIGRRIRSS